MILKKYLVGIALLIVIAVVFDTGCASNGDPEPAECSTGVTYVTDIKPIFEANCLISGCHLNNANGMGDWGIYSEAYAKRALIKSRTQDGSMPAVGSLTETEKALIACWVDSGAPEN